MQVREPRSLDLCEAVLSIEKMLRRVLGEDIELAIVAATGASVFADPGQLEQILMNLAVNARDAMPNGGKLTIDIANVVTSAGNEHGVGAGRYVVLSVADTGIGMSSATRERIFEPFFTTKEVGKGTGLGLSTVFGIVKQSDGHITVESEPNRGTTFKIFLPASDAPVVSAATPPAPLVSVRGTETILLVEDDLQVRAATGMTLRRHGYNVIDAQNAGEAFLLCEKHDAEIHLMVTDVVMPHMNGPDLAKRLAVTRPRLRVLYVSGYAEHSVVHGGVIDEGIDFLAKPLTPSSLLPKVRELLDRPNRFP
jgi:CheY-like chemotaxis protein